MEQKKIIISTGGTGGHIFPAIVLAKYLKKNKFDVLLIGNKKIDDYIKKDELEYKIINSGYNLKSFKSIKNIIYGIIQSVKIFKEFKPDLVVGFGSYATLPVLIVAYFKKINLYLHEQNSHIGRINRFFSKYAKFCFLLFKEFSVFLIFFLFLLIF